jgi:hypothetical protein
MEWFLAELQAVADRYRWQYVAPNGQQQVEQIAYRIWQQEGCPQGRQEEHWRQAEKEFHADKPIRGALVSDLNRGQVSQLLSPLQAVLQAQAEAASAVSPTAQSSEVGFPLTPREAGAIEAAAAAASEGYSPAFRTGMARAVGLEG